MRRAFDIKWVVLCVVSLYCTKVTGADDAISEYAIAEYAIVEDGIRQPLTSTLGDSEAGRLAFSDRESGHCLLCHIVKSLDEPFQGTIGPDLTDVADRLSVPQLRLRVVDQSHISPETIMPSYHKTEGLNQVWAPYVGKPVLTAQEVEDVVTYLSTLTSEGPSDE